MKQAVIRKALTAAAAVLITSSSLMNPVSANEDKKASAAISVELNGYSVPLPFESKPFISNGRVQLPMRYLFEALGAQVQYDAKTKTITAVHKDTNVTLKINGSDMQVGDKIVKLDSPAQIVNSKAFVPVRAVTESLGASVSWDQKLRTVHLTSPVINVAAPDPETLDSGLKEEMKQRSPSNQASLALHWLYNGELQFEPHIAGELMPILEEARQSVPAMIRFWIRENGSRQEGDRFLFEFVVTGEDEKGSIREFAVDVVEVSMVSDQSGSVVTGYSHLDIPANVTSSAARIWIGSGELSTFPPHEITGELPSAVVKDNKTLLPIEILKSFGDFFSKNKDGMYSVSLPGGKPSAGIKAVTIQGQSYLSIEQLISVFHNLSIVVPGESTDHYSVRWDAESKQLRIDIDHYHPVS